MSINNHKMSTKVKFILVLILVSFFEKLRWKKYELKFYRLNSKKFDKSAIFKNKFSLLQMDLGKPSRLLKELKSTNFLTHFNVNLCFYSTNSANRKSYMAKFLRISKTHSMKCINNSKKISYFTVIYSSSSNESKEELAQPYKSSYIITLHALIIRLKRCLLIYL